MRLPPFEIHRPESIWEACHLLADLGDEAVAYNGGTELILTMKLGLANYSHLVDLKLIDELNGIRHEGNSLWIGSGMTHHELETSTELRSSLPGMAEMVRQLANVRVRSVGTIGGNLCFADPHSDPATFLAAMDASMICDDGRNSRRVKAEEFVVGPYETALRTGELLVGVEVPIPGHSAGVAHVRLKTHERPTVTVAAMVELTDGRVKRARLVVGSVCGVPAVVGGLEELVGSDVTEWEERVEVCALEAAKAVDPFEDAEGSVEYKRALVQVFVRRGLHAALSAVGNGGDRRRERDP